MNRELLKEAVLCLASRKILLALKGKSSMMEGLDDLLPQHGARGVGRAGPAGLMVRPFAVETDPIEEYGLSGATVEA